jgi:hypothetical protein
MPTKQQMVAVEQGSVKAEIEYKTQLYIGLNTSVKGLLTWLVVSLIVVAIVVVVGPLIMSWFQVDCCESSQVEY